MQSLCGLQHLDFNMPHVHSYEQYMRTILTLRLGATAIDQAWIRCAFNMAAVNCDDHTKNLSFLMDKTGNWTLAPAYDNCFAHNPGTGKWTRTHQIQLQGKTWDVTAEDLLLFAKTFNVTSARERLQKIADAVARWPLFAKEAEVSPSEQGRIQRFHPGWVRHLG